MDSTSLSHLAHRCDIDRRNITKMKSADPGRRQGGARQGREGFGSQQPAAAARPAAARPPAASTSSSSSSSRNSRNSSSSSSSRPGSCNRFALNRIQKGRQASGSMFLEVVPSFSSMVFRCGEGYVVEACSTSSSSTTSSSSRKQEEKVAKIIFFYGFQKLH